MRSLAGKPWFLPVFTGVIVLTSAVIYTLPFWGVTSQWLRQFASAALGVAIWLVLAVIYEILAARAK